MRYGTLLINYKSNTQKVGDEKMTKRYLIYLVVDDDQFEDEILEKLVELKNNKRINKFKLQLIEEEW